MQFHFIGTSMEIFQDLTVLVYLSMMQIILQLYYYIKVHLKQVANLLVFLKVFNVPDNISRIRVQFESLVNVSHDTYSGHRLLRPK